MFFSQAIGARPQNNPVPMPDAAVNAEAKLRHFILSMQYKHPCYDDLEMPLAVMARQQAPHLQQMFDWLGALRSVHLIRKQGQEYVFELWFSHGRLLVGAIPSSSGRFSGLRLGLSHYK